MSEKIRVLVVDDSAIVREVLSRLIGGAPDMELAGTAPDPFIARDKILRTNPDVLTLDIEMPRMDGLSFLERLMHYRPLPVVVVSSVTTKDSTAVVRALELGAFDVVNKPGDSTSVGEVGEQILEKIRAAYRYRDQFIGKWCLLKEKGARSGPPSHHLSVVETTEKLVVVGASTGGTVALEEVLSRLPRGMPPVVVVQHMPPVFTAQFARRLDELCTLRVKEAEDGERLEKGTVYIAPGGYHLVLERRGEFLYVRLTRDEKVNFQRPSVDVLFESAAEVAGKNTLGVLLTGMGKDGAEGLLRIKESGGHTIAQDEASSIVWGMPRVAVEMGAAKEVLPLDRIAERMVTLVSSEGGG
ncbi:response regulator receiver modulated CheB methylesterase [Spirochaeta thermophila DSM 6578]|uniref:Protein-glutamate methylesterase/protein-glutamine glutaminase n=1 Tax=Winmispira thermophila (strain ATCC 700085 / DSM 6578 / Z-1203) TaxID=869211 RepID=G0GC33_WINT7|nr:chemotaxis response regulator protein-glutamate methylesterase [Spirochaeta thermophila]AEJ60397.1 response regulator receiver modulated CheB methylesterase [Spirochaeta thermophila DSM 6578]